ncbi:MAG: hypothetical protein IMZ64_07475 [Bacteroidetes bacterium]|nr:hypothetical protein [Bacteroidota bacterium]
MKYENYERVKRLVDEISTRESTLQQIIAGGVSVAIDDRCANNLFSIIVDVNVTAGYNETNKQCVKAATIYMDKIKVILLSELKDLHKELEEL